MDVSPRNGLASSVMPCTCGTLRAMPRVRHVFVPADWYSLLPDIYVVFGRKIFRGFAVAIFICGVDTWVCSIAPQGQ